MREGGGERKGVSERGREGERRRREKGEERRNEREKGCR